jgi:hypothetical protein
MNSPDGCTDDRKRIASAIAPAILIGHAGRGGAAR